MFKVPVTCDRQQRVTLFLLPIKLFDVFDDQLCSRPFLGLGHGARVEQA